MKTYEILFFLLVSALFLFITGCSSPMDSSDDTQDNEPAYNVTLSDISIQRSVTITTDPHNYKKIVFNYPTKTVSGQTITASAIILIPEYIYNNKPKLDYMILMSHGATTYNGNVPSSGQNTGELDDYMNVTYDTKKVIGVAADYIGFGSSSDIPQAFAFGDVNARTSLQALICARLWLASQGYTWQDKLANIGYSQGGQTAMHVQKLVDTTTAYGSKVSITKTFAGAGPYSINTTIDKSLSDYTPTALSPFVIWLGILSYNNLVPLNVPENQVFTNPTEIHNQVLNNQVPNRYNEAWSSSLTSDMCNATSSLRHQIRQQLLNYNCNFTPKAGTKIIMLSDSNDDVVPTQNSDDLYNYFVSHNYPITQATSASSAAFSADCQYIRYSTGNFGQNTHGSGGAAFKDGVKAELNSSRW